jgi:hypothetical protein
VDDAGEIKLRLSKAGEDTHGLARSLRQTLDDLGSILGSSQRLGRPDDDARGSPPPDRDESEQCFLQAGRGALADPTLDCHPASEQEQLALLLDGSHHRSFPGVRDRSDQHVDRVAAYVDCRDAFRLAHQVTSGSAV